MSWGASWGWAVLRGGVLAAVAGISAASVCGGVGVAAAAVGAWSAALWVQAARALRVRGWAALGTSLLLAGGLGGAATLAARGVGLAELLGPARALTVLEAVGAFCLCFAGFTVLRLAAERSGWGRLLEASAVVVAVASILAAHRDGMIARPLEISDWFWSRGVDPVWAFLVAGAVVSLLVAALWLQRRPWSGAVGALAAFGVLLGSVMWWLQQQPLPAGEPLRSARGAGPSDPQRSGEGSEGSRADDRRQPGEPPPPDEQEPKRVPVGVVVFHRDVDPWGGYFYFRTTAFSRFNGIRLVEALRPDLDGDVPPGFPVGEDLELQPAPQHPVRMDVAADVALLTEHRRPFVLVDPLRLEPRPNPSPARFRRAYHTVSRLLVGPTESLFGHRPGGGDWDSETWHHYTEIPSDPRYLELATRLVAQLKSEYRSDPFAQALAFKQYLERESVYSFKKKYASDTDPTAAFLFSEDKVGYCVHLAHSMALLMRAVGLPARVSAGYAVDARQRGRGSALLVTNADAHAWAELYLNDVGWIPIEVVPEQTDVEPAPFEAQDLQQLLGEMARDEGRTERLQTAPYDWSWLGVWARRSPWLLGAGLLTLYAVRWVRRIRPRFAAEQSRLRHAYVAILDELAAGGSVRRRGESREAFARRMGSSVPAFERLSAEFLRHALGPSTARPGPTGFRRGPSGLSLWRDGLVEARRRLPAWRKVLAWLHPAPYWRVR